MANIRFVKPANDNRIRSFPDTLIQDHVTNIASSVNKEVVSFGTSKIYDKNVTTPKDKVDNVNKPDIFITNRIDNHSQNMPSLPRIDQKCNRICNKRIDNVSQSSDNFDTSREHSLQKYSSTFQDNASLCNCQMCLSSNSNSVPSSEKDQNYNAPTETEKNDNSFESFYEHKNLNSITGDQVNKTIKNTVEMSQKIADIFSDQTKASQNIFSTESSKEKDHIKCSGKKLYKKFATISDCDISEVLDEELDQLPEIIIPGNTVLLNGCQKTRQERYQQEEQHKLQNQEEQKQHSASSSTLSSSRQHKNRQQSCRLDNDTGYRHRENNRPIHRSVSDAALIDGVQIPSFFRSINDALYYGIDKEEPFDIADMTGSLGGTHISTKINGHRDFTDPAKIAWDTGSNNHVFVTTFDRSTDKDIGVTSGKSPKSKSCEGHHMMFRSLSGDSVITDRLRSRRCALADPENMIMRQDVREKIEKEVERRRSSMTRKISQFFNVHLGLNREEDLI